MKKVAFCLILALALLPFLSAQENPSITIVNNTGYRIISVHFSSVKSDTWGPDRLAEDQVLLDGQTVTLRLPDPLHVENKYDILLIDLDEDVYIKWDVTVSANSRIVFTFDDIDLD